MPSSREQSCPERRRWSSRSRGTLLCVRLPPVLTRSLLLLALAAVSAGLVLAGCGGSEDSSTASAANWASGYCSASSSWVATLHRARASVAAATTPEEAAQTVTD